jgi:hypothetical protein
MNLQADQLLHIIGKQQVMIELLQAQLKQKEDHGARDNGNHSGTSVGPPPWAKATAEKGSSA